MADGERYALAHLFGTARQELINHVPHVRGLGMEVVEVGPRRARVRLPYRDELVGDPLRKVVFGGVITTLIDHAAGLSVFCSLEELRGIATLDLRIDYMKPATPGRDIVGYCRCYKVTRNIAFVRGVAYHDTADDPIATMVASFMLGANRAMPGVYAGA